ncbi:MAG: hypothetical protein AAGC53_02660 [Actinomycetota bacterium]
MSVAILDEIEAYLDALEAGLQSGEPNELELTDLDLTGQSVEAADEERARNLLARLGRLQERTEGQRVRIAGEIAGLRRRTVNDGHRRGPSAFDSSF